MPRSTSRKALRRGGRPLRRGILTALLAAAPRVARGDAPDAGAVGQMAFAAATSQVSLLGGRYVAHTDVAALAALDVDRRSVVARVSSHTPEGLRDAAAVYVNGMSDAPAGPTLERLSTLAGEELRSSPTFQTFRDYYGGPDYADRWIRAAFDGDATTFDHGNADFREFGDEGRAAAVRWATVLLNVWMHVVGRVESAAAGCSDDEDDNGGVLMDWDAAAALLIGSTTTGHNNGGGGHLLFKIIQVECENFGMCKKGALAPANDRLLDALVDGQAHLQMGNCNEVLEKAKDIKAQATIPLVQGVLRAMYEIDRHDDHSETMQGMGAAFAAAVSPLLDKCSQGNAMIIHKDLAPGAATTGSFDVVKDALERSYDCLGITCEDVGGLVNFRGDGYLERAEACGGFKPADVSYDDSGDGFQPADVGYGDSQPADVGYGDSQPADVGYGDSGDEVNFGDGGAAAEDRPRTSTADEESAYVENGMSALFAALLSGVIFGGLGVIGGAAIGCAYVNHKKEKPPAPAAEDGDVLRSSDFMTENNII